MAKILHLLNKSFATYNIRGLYIEATYWQAAAIIILVFLLVFTLARLRYLYIHWSLGKSSIAMIFWGFLLALILEGFLLIGGRTMLTEVLGWRNAPKPLSTLLDSSRSKLINVLGVNSTVTESEASANPTFDSVMLDYQSLSLEEMTKVKSVVCEP